MPATDIDHPSDRTTESELGREQRHLTHARAQLDRMRRKTEALRDRAVGGDRVSTEYLAGMLHERAKSLVDDPASTLFFGRLDLDENLAGQDATLEEEPGAGRWYIGRRHVMDENGDPVVIDWRARLSGRFYRATRERPLGVTLRRRFGVEHGRLTAYEDEHLQDPAETGGHSEIVRREIERPRVGPMRDIVATIQPEQDELVRADAATTVCIQGAPGTGKTAVGLHRAAWLLYAHRDRLSRTGVLVVGPNAAFLEHIGAVLPALGEVSVRHSTAEDLVASVPVRGTDPVERAVLKGDARLAEVLRRAVWSHVGTPAEPLIVPRGARRWRVPAYLVAEVLDELRARRVSYAAAGAMLPQRLAHLVLLAMERSGDSPDDRVQDAVARHNAVRAYAGALWPTVDPRTVLFRLLSEAELLAAAAEGLLSAEEQRILLWDKPARTRGAVRWSAADAALLDEMGDLVTRTPSLGHVVLDEAQDLSPMQLRAVGRRCSTGSATVLGDIAQGTTPWATASWDDVLVHLGKPDGNLEVLDRGFRVPAVVIDYAARLLPHMAPGLGPPRSVRETPGRLELVAVSPGDLPARLVAAVVELAREPGSVGVIAPDADTGRLSGHLTAAGIEHGVLGADHGDVEQVDVVPATVAKGLEFDRVLVVEPAAIAAAEPDQRTGLRRLYVVLTRAVSALVVLHAQPLPAELDG